MIDLESINEARSTMVKNETSAWADEVRPGLCTTARRPRSRRWCWRSRILRDARFPAGDGDGLPRQPVSESFARPSIRVLRCTSNHTIYPFNVKEVRQA